MLLDATRGSRLRLQTTLHATSEGHPAQSRSNKNTYTDVERVPSPPPPARNRDGHMRLSSRRQTWMSGHPN